MHTKFPKIDNFHSVRKHVCNHIPKATYRAKTKLHGTNASVQIKEKEVFAQSRSRIITVGDDNAGFAKWVDENVEFFESINPRRYPITIFGEWCGEGIMKGTAINNIGRKVFAVFAVQYGNTDDEDATVIVEPMDICNVVPTHDDIFILPWETDSISIEFNNKENLEDTMFFCNKLVESIEQVDPWVFNTFDVQGPGEGYVFVPAYANEVPRHLYSKLAFKAKGEKHKVTKQKKAVQVDPETAKSVEEYVNNVVTEARLEQAVREVNRGELVFNKKQIGPFLKWISQDIKEETQTELEAANLDWKDVAKPIIHEARAWFSTKEGNL